MSNVHNMDNGHLSIYNYSYTHRLSEETDPKFWSCEEKQRDLNPSRFGIRILSHQSISLPQHISVNTFIMRACNIRWDFIRCRPPSVQKEAKKRHLFHKKKSYNNFFSVGILLCFIRVDQIKLHT